MPLIQLIVIIVAVGVLLWAVNKFLGPYMQGTILQILNIAVPIILVVYILYWCGVFNYLGGINLGPQHSVIIK